MYSATTLPFRMAAERAGLSERRRSLRSQTRAFDTGNAPMVWSSTRGRAHWFSAPRLFHEFGQLLQRSVPGFHGENSSLRVSVGQAAFNQRELHAVLVD